VSNGKRRLRRYLVWLGLLVLLCASPTIWLLAPENRLRIRVVDKTVPHPTYREHASLLWLLSHEKTTPPGYHRPWVLGRDYVGYYPDETNKCFGTHEKLTEKHLEDIDLLYLADVYGVYTLDMEGCPESKPALDYSGLIFGGFDELEADLIERFVHRDRGMLVAEFNTFASPTHGAARFRLSVLLGVVWTDWSGRYFESLADKEDVPVWARRLYQRQYGQPWKFKGPGFVFVNEDERIFVLRAPEETSVGGAMIHNVATDDPLLAGTQSREPFLYWFDVVIPLSQTEVLAEYRMLVNAAGAEKMAAFKIPTTFPAVIRASKHPLRLYFAGDFADNRAAGGPHFLAGWTWLGRHGLLGGDVEYEEAFHWRYYVPLIRNLLRIAEESLGE